MKLLKSLLIFTSIFLLIQWSYAAGIVDVGSSGGIKSIVHFSSSGDLLGTIFYLAQDVIDFVRLALNGVALLVMLYVGFIWVTSM